MSNETYRILPVSREIHLSRRKELVLNVAREERPLASAGELHESIQRAESHHIRHESTILVEYPQSTDELGRPKRVLIGRSAKRLSALPRHHHTITPSHTPLRITNASCRAEH
jgi:hypothetical protein